MTTLVPPLTRLSPMMALVLLRDLTQSTFLMAASRPSTTMPMTMMVSSLRSAMMELLPMDLHLLLLLMLLLLLLPTLPLLLLMLPLSSPMLLLTLLHMLLLILLLTVLPPSWDKED